MEELLKLWQSMGIANVEWGQALMMIVGCLLIYLAIAKKFEPLLLVPIGFGAVLSNIPIAGIGGPVGLIGMIYLVTILLGLAVGSKLSADKFLTLETLGILVLGALAFCVGTAAGVLMGKLLHRVTGGQANPLIGAAGVSAVPMAARVVNNVGLEEDHHNFLLMHAMGPNVAGVIGSAVAAGVLLALVG